MTRTLWRWGWLVPVLLAGLLYARAINGELVWDDELVQKDELVAFHGAHDAFFMPTNIPQWSRNYYRPVVMLTYLVERSWFGPGATRGPHAAVILFHMIATFFVWLLARRILRDREWGGLGALAAGTLFAVHPIHAEDVCWITARPDIVATMFALPAAITALHFRDHRSRWALVLSPLLFLGAVFSKEVAVSMVLVLPVLFLLVPPPSGRVSGGGKPRAPGPPRPVFRLPRRSWLPLAGLYLAALGIYGWLRAVNHVNRVALLPLGWLDLLDRMMAAFAYYLVKLVVPPPQSVYTLSLPPAWAVVPVLAAAAGLLAVGVWRSRRGDPFLLLGLGWVLLTVAPSLAIAVGKISETPVAERYLYLPSVGVCLLAGGWLSAAWPRRTGRMIAAALAVGVTVSFMILTVGRVRVWQNDVTLWSDVTRHDPPAGLPWLNLGQAAFKHGDAEKALACFHTALTRYTSAEGRALAWNSIGAVLRGKDPDRAADAFRKSISERPQYATPYFNLGMIGLAKCDRDWAETGTYDPATLDSTRTAFTRAIQYNRYYTWAYLGLARSETKIAVAHSMAGDLAKARAALQEARANLQAALRLDPGGVHSREAAMLLNAVETDLARLGN